MARFASSVSLSYRAPQAGDPTKAAADPTAQLAMELSALEMPSPPPTPPANGVPQAWQLSANSEEPSKKRSNPNFNQSSGKDYLVFEGTVLETTLVTRLNGDFSGPVICMMTNSIYSHDGQRLLIPAGTKVMGQTKRVAVLNKINAASMLLVRTMQDTNKLLASLLEQQLVTTERNRTTGVGTINTELYRQQHFSDTMSFTGSIPTQLQTPTGR